MRYKGGFAKGVTGTVTVWPLYADIQTGEQVCVRRVLRGCFWDDDSISVFKKTGLQSRNSVTVYIPYSSELTGCEYISPDEWYRLDISGLEGYWTIDPHCLPLMVKGDNTHEFHMAAPTAADRIAAQETELMKLNPYIHRVMDVNHQHYGSPVMWHTVVRC